MSNYKKALMLLIVVAFVGLGAHNLIANKHEADSTKRELQQVQQEHQTTEQELKQLEGTNQKTLDEKRRLEKKDQQQQQKIKELEQQLSVKRENARRLANAATLTQTASAAPRAVTPSGSCADWIAAAGIGDVANANELIRRESGCNPQAKNPSSGACGVAQELPCGKSGCAWGDGACQVKWMNSYVLGRYGSWAAAVSFHNANNWY